MHYKTNVSCLQFMNTMNIVFDLTTLLFSPITLYLFKMLAPYGDI